MTTAARVTGGVVVGLLAAAAAAAWAPDWPVEVLTPRWARPPSRFLAIDGMQVHVRDEGPADDPTPLVLLHGTGSSLQTWDGWVDRLTATHRVIRLDRPGFGLTGPNPSGDYTMASSAEFVRRILDRLHVRRAILVGNSSGGRVAWQVAVAFPDRVAALVLIAPAGYPRTTPLPLGLRLAMSPIFGPLLTHVLPRSAVARGVRDSYGDPSKVTPEVVERTYEITRRAGNRRALGETLRQAQGADDAPRIRDVRAPTLILWGTRDPVIPPADAARFHADVAGSTVVLLPGVGHVAQEEDPAGTVAAVRRFLAGASR